MTLWYYSYCITLLNHADDKSGKKTKCWRVEGKLFREKYLNLRLCNDIEIHSLPNTKRLKVYVMPTQIAQRNVR